MTPEDVAALRRLAEHALPHDTRALCDALEQAWAERDGERITVDELIGRAERAEAANDEAIRQIGDQAQELTEQILRAERAESALLEKDVLIGMMREDNNKVHDTAVFHAERAERAEAQCMAGDLVVMDLVARAERAEARLVGVQALRDQMNGWDLLNNPVAHALAHVVGGIDR